MIIMKRDSRHLSKTPLKHEIMPIALQAADLTDEISSFIAALICCQAQIQKVNEFKKPISR